MAAVTAWGGLGVYDQIEKTSVFPVVIVDWRLNDRWRLVNPLPSGPTGPAGLELDYRFDGDWTAGGGVAYRSVRFRLNDRASAPGGVGEESGVPLFLRVTRNLGPQMALHLYGGAVVGGTPRLEDASGNLIKKEFQDTPADRGLFGGAFFIQFDAYVCLAVRCNGAPSTLHGWQGLPQPCCPQWRWVFIHVENGSNQKVPDELFQFGEHLVPREAVYLRTNPRYSHSYR